MKKKQKKLGRKLLGFLLTLAMVFGTFTGIVPGTGITAKADTSDTGVEVLIADIDCEDYKDKTTSFTTDDGIANISFSATPEFHEYYGWYNPNGDLTITVTAANDDYPISKCMFQCNADGREDSTAPFAVTISYDGDWNNTTATINDETKSSGGLKHIGIFSRITPDYTVLKDGMLIKPGESIIPGDYYYKTAEHVNTDDPEYRADFKKNTLYTLVKGNIESRQVDPSYDPDWVEDVFVESNNGDHYAFLQVANGNYIFDGSWEVTNHADGMLVSQGTSESMSNPEERITTYAFSVHEKVINDVTVDSTIENGSIEIKDSEGTAISEAEAGSIVTLDVSADEGYKLKEISAKYLEIQSVSELMEMMGDTKYYANPNDTDYSDYYMATADGIKCFWFYGDEKAFLSKTAELDKSKSVEGVYTAIGTYDDAPLTWIFKVKNGKIISIGFERNGVDWGIVNIESTGTIAEPTYASVELTTVTEGEKYTFTMPATDVTVNAVFEESITKYPLWIGGEQVTSENLSGEGWKYTPETKQDWGQIDPAYLTLEGYSYDGAGHSGNGNTFSGAIYTEQNLMIELKKETSNSIISSGSDAATSCAIYVGGNLDIFGNGSLTAGGPMGIVAGNDLKIYCDTNSLPSGSMTVTGSNGDGLLSINGNIEIQDGNLTLNGSTYGVSTGNHSDDGTGDLKVTGGTITVNTDGDYGIFVKNMELTRGAPTGTTVTATGKKQAICADNVTVDEYMYVKAGTDKDNSSTVENTDTWTHTEKWVKTKIFPTVYVGGTQVTRSNMSGEGWSFDPDSDTLTMNGYNYEGTGYLDGDRHFAGAIYAGQSLNIELNGDSELVNTRNDENSVYDIIVMGKLSISGTGTLTAKANNACIHATREIEIESGTINATSDGDAWGGGCLLSRDVTINGGTVNATGASRYGGIYANNNVTINGGTVNATATGEESAAIYLWNDMTINGGTVTVSATGNNSMGISDPNCDPAKSITLNGGLVTAFGTSKAVNASTVTIGEGVTVKAGDDEDSATDVTDTFSTTHDQKWMQVVLPHNHRFKYTADGDTITANCSDSCDINEGLTLTIIAPTELTYDGRTKVATLSTGYNTTVFPDEYTIKYYQGENEVEATNVKATGDYTAKVTVGDVTASVDFTITKAASSIKTLPTAKTLTYIGSKQALVIAGEATGGEMQYALGTATEATQPYSTSIPTATDAGTYYVWYKVKGDKNHNDVEPKSLVVTINEKQQTSNGTITTDGIYCASNHPSIQAGMVIHKSNEADTVEYRWVGCDSSKPGKWFEVSPWTKDNNWMNWTPEKSGSYVFVCYARVVGNEEESLIQYAFGTEYHRGIKGICQMPYSGEGGGYLIGIESYYNPYNSYQFEILILDCNLYMQGKDAWVYTTGRCGMSNCLWTVWQPTYGYYWTLFRIYDADGNMIDEQCYGFANIF